MLHIRPPGIHATAEEREAWIERVRRDSQTLDSIAKVLDHIRESVADVLQSAQETISRQLAFPLIPDEVLIRILSYAVECDSSTDTAKELMSLSSVCRRFRRLLCSAPHLWTKINNDMNGTQAGCFLEHSKDEELFITFRDNETHQRTKQVLAKVIDHYRRWRTFELSLTVAENRLPTDKMYESLGDISETLPVLHELIFRRSIFLDGILEIVDHFGEPSGPIDDGGLSHFYEKWDAPNLRIFRVENLIPLPFQSPSLRLVELSIELLEPYWSQPRDPLTSLMLFLDSQPSLEILAIVIVEFEDGTTFPVERRVTLPALRELTLHSNALLANGMSTRSIPGILRALQTPSLRKLSLSLPVFETSDPTLGWIFAHEDCFLNTEELTLDAYMDQPMPVSGFNAHLDQPIPASRFKLRPLRTIIRQFPKLKHLCLSTDKFEVTTEDLEAEPPNIYPPLEIVHFKNCKAIRVEVIVAFIRCLKDGAHEQWSKFKGIVVEDCKRLNRDEVVSSLIGLLPEEKIKFLNNSEMMEIDT